MSKTLIKKKPDPINPWMGEAILAFRKQFPDDLLREMYEDRVKRRPRKSWQSFISETALTHRIMQDPFLATPQEEFDLPDDGMMLMELLCVETVADLMQFTMEELEELADQAEIELQPVLNFLAAHGYVPYSSDYYTYKVYIPEEE